MLQPETEIVESILTAGFTAVLRNDGIVQFNMHPAEGNETSITDIRNMTDAMLRLGKGKQLPVLIVIEKYSDLATDARTYAASEEALKYTKANAMVINSMISRVAANFFIQFSKPVRPTKMFNSEKNAVAWLNSL